MPHFLAPLAGHASLTGDLFALDVEIPGAHLTHAVAAIICPEVERSFISRELAAQLGLPETGGEASVRIKQWSTLTGRLHEFDPIPVSFRPAHARLGGLYLGLGIEALEEFFELHRWDPQDEDNPSPPFIFIEPHPLYRAWCHQVA
ncbi:MAG TPA: hypothetical protein VFI31_14685 [Pirellulales bacterium]|nr:hypothetical protein [Pirellulales bacterium]